MLRLSHKQILLQMDETGGSGRTISFARDSRGGFRKNSEEGRRVFNNVICSFSTLYLYRSPDPLKMIIALSPAKLSHPPHPISFQDDSWLTQHSSVPRWFTVVPKPTLVL